MRKPDALAHDAGRKMKRGVAPLHRFKPWPSNPRTHPPAEIALLAELLKTYGADQDIVVDEDWWILKGHGRRQSALLAGMEEFPFTQRLDMTDAEKEAMRIEDNQVTLLAGWDKELVRLSVANLQKMNYPINRLGFGLEIVQFTVVSGIPGDEPKALGSLAERFGVVPFSVINAREGWWQDRKRAWLALGIQSELGRGENLIGRSPQELFCHLSGIPYNRARQIVEEAMAQQGDAFDLQKLVAQYKKRPPPAIPGGAGKNSVYRNRANLGKSKDGAQQKT